MALSLPYPALTFVPLDVLTAEEMNQIVSNYTYISNQFPLAGTNIADGAISTAKIDWSSSITDVTNLISISYNTCDFNGQIYKKSDKTIIMNIDISFGNTAPASTAGFVNIGTLQAGARPANDIYVLIREPWANTFHDVRIRTTGEVQIYVHSDVKNKGLHGIATYISA